MIRVFDSAFRNFVPVGGSPSWIQFLQLVEKSRDQILRTHGAMAHSAKANFGHIVLPPLDVCLHLHGSMVLACCQHPKRKNLSLFAEHSLRRVETRKKKQPRPSVDAALRDSAMVV